MFAPMTGTEALLGSAVQQHRHAELIEIAQQDRLGRSVRRERKAARLAARLARRVLRREPLVQPGTATPHPAF